MNKTNLNFGERIFHLMRQLVDKFTYSKDLFADDVWRLRVSKQFRQKDKYASLHKRLFAFSFKEPDDFYKYLFIIVMAVMLVNMVLMSRNVGISTRELEQNHYSELVYNHFHHIGDTEAYKEHPFASTQAQYIDLILFSLCKALHIQDIFMVKHITSAIFGWLLILYLSILVLRAFRWRAAFFTAFFLLISPRFLGYSLCNVVDVTFAFGFIFAITQIYYFCRELPTIRIYRVLKIIWGILIALSTYNAGFVLLHFLFIFTLLNFLLYNPIKKFFKWEYLKPLLQLVALVYSISLLIMCIHCLCTIFLTTSMVPPRQAFVLLANNYPLSDNQLFAGYEIGPDNFPRRYLIQYLFITIPSVVLMGFLLFFIFFKTAVRNLKPFSIFIFLYAFCYCIMKVKNIYMNPDTAWAIYYFIYPLFMLIAVSGIECTLESIQDRYTNVVIIAIIGLLSFMPIRHIAYNHPLTALYFNELSGGIHNAYAKYELDYNDLCNKKACQAMQTYIHREDVGQHVSQEPFLLATNGNAACELFFHADSNIVLVHTPYLASDTTWDYYLYFCHDIAATQLRNGTWPVDTPFTTLNIENKPIVAFYKNRYRAAQRAYNDSIAKTITDSLTALADMEGIEK
ncbi:MAG: hypothetical protein K5846_02535 [Bacteroidales bacterium]|nr:hypothetical protein [Bacteroidales bacterium]